MIIVLNPSHSTTLEDTDDKTAKRDQQNDSSY